MTVERNLILAGLTVTTSFVNVILGTTFVVRYIRYRRQHNFVKEEWNLGIEEKVHVHGERKVAEIYENPLDADERLDEGGGDVESLEKSQRRLVAPDFFERFFSEKEDGNNAVEKRDEDHNREEERGCEHGFRMWRTAGMENRWVDDNQCKNRPFPSFRENIC
ncbi:hypothetical protein L596_006954 [Steinernema carpocapsae]|uniref:Uncharacterized protein n=1 Tax=Steinernema carpocapsae TaxID=34508 RepID=A0A4U5P8R4_STECR|nr:hypothetical protein L596_006954 [Steinernema carpocapsae]